jgi:diguanylate cyclase (GGDEF)-like protein
MDELTKLPIRDDLARELGELGDDAWIAAIFLDIDGFAWVNDQFGHLKGDEDLVILARWLEREALTDGSRVFRVGGDEFLMLLPEKTLAQAASIAERLVANCAALRLPFASRNEPRDMVTISAVVFAASREMSSQLVKLLDVFAYSLYLAEVARGRKHSNVVVCD